MISQKVVEWFADRGIGEQTLEVTGIYSGQHLKDGDSFKIVPSNDDSAIIVYPYLRQGEEVNAKYRGRGKKFYQKPNGVKTFFNVDVLDDPSVQDGTNPLVITEGENDTLAAIEAGYPFVVSVPDGAPPPSQGWQEEDIDPEHDTKYGYIFHNWQQLRGLRRIIIATDCDDPGRRLAEELVRRLGRVRCQFVTYPAGSKDLNEVLLNHGKDAVLLALRTAQPYPISGVYTYSQLPPEPDVVPLSTGWGRMDTFIRPFFPAFMVVTGTAGSGKSTWVNQLVAQMSLLHGISVAIASFEMRIKPFVTDVLCNTYEDMGNNVVHVKKWLEESFVFIAPEPGGEPTDTKLGGYGDNPDGNFDIDWLIDKAKDAVLRHGIRILVLDPWNEVEHAVRRMENHSNYVGRTIRALKRFGKEFDVLVIVVAHPSKGGAEKAKVKSIHKDKYGNMEEITTNEITLYDVSDSAHFANKADFGVVIHRIDGSNQTNVKITKVRYQPITGQLGMVPIVYDGAKKIFSR